MTGYSPPEASHPPPERIKAGVNLRTIEKLLPEGFALQWAGGKLCLYRQGQRAQILALAGDPPVPVGYLRGRGRPAVVEAGGDRLVVRHYFHGGVLRRLTGDLFFGVKRPLNELRLLERARRGGVRVPEPVGLLLVPVPPFFFRADLVTVYIPQSQDLLSYYRDPDPPGRKNLAAIIAAAARQTALLHRAGISHGDLQLKNILIRPSARPPEAFILDFDRSRPSPGGDGPRRENLLRLLRSFQKMRFSLPTVSRRDPLRFLRAYAPKERVFRRRLITAARRRRRWAFLRRGKWKLSILFGGGYYARPMNQE